MSHATIVRRVGNFDTTRLEFSNGCVATVDREDHGGWSMTCDGGPFRTGCWEQDDGYASHEDAVNAAIAAVDRYEDFLAEELAAEAAYELALAAA